MKTNVKLQVIEEIQYNLSIQLRVSLFNTIKKIYNTNTFLKYHRSLFNTKITKIIKNKSKKLRITKLYFF